MSYIANLAPIISPLLAIILVILAFITLYNSLKTGIYARMNLHSNCGPSEPYKSNVEETLFLSVGNAGPGTALKVFWALTGKPRDSSDLVNIVQGLVTGIAPNGEQEVERRIRHSGVMPAGDQIPLFIDAKKFSELIVYMRKYSRWRKWSSEYVEKHTCGYIEYRFTPSGDIIGVGRNRIRLQPPRSPTCDAVEKVTFG